MRGFFLFRHAKSDHNPASGHRAVFAGSELDSPLTDAGRGQARELVRKVVALRGIDAITALASSPLARAQETARIFQDELADLGSEVELVVIEQLHELSVGEFSGRSRSEVREQFPAEAEAFYSGDVRNIDFPGGESFVQASERARNVLDELQNQFPGPALLGIVGHAMFNQIMLWTLGERTYARQFGYPHGRVLEVIAGSEARGWQAASVQAVLEEDGSMHRSEETV